MDSKFKRIYLGILACTLIAVLSVSTYAWFSNNKTVDTTMVTGRTSDGAISLLLSSKGGSNFSGKTEVALTQVNDADTDFLMPVSTADLSTFLYNDHTQAGDATYFTKVKNEDYIYHGRVYLKIDDKSAGASSHKVKLYLDQSDEAGGSIVSSKNQNILNAGRIGLVFNGDSSTAVILRISDSKNKSSERINNTVIDGKRISEGQVLQLKNGKVQAVSDPSHSLSDYVIKINNNSVELPERYVATIDMNKVYSVDVYFYLEGCDFDCTDSVQFKKTDLHIAFYGVMED